jgi:hypothetical protein
MQPQPCHVAPHGAGFLPIYEPEEHVPLNEEQERAY